MDLLFEFRSAAFPLGDYSKSYTEIIGFTDKREKSVGPSYVQVTQHAALPERRRCTPR